MGELVRQTVRIELKPLFGWALSTLALIVALAAFFLATADDVARLDQP